MQEKEVIVRNMQSDDLDCVMRIWLESNIGAHSFIDDSYWKNNYDTVRTVIPDSEVYVCEYSGVIVGFIGLSGNYIAGLFVASDFQSRGIGKRLLDYVKTFKAELSLNVYSKNCRAGKFYEREGFVRSAESVDTKTGELEYLLTLQAND